MRSQNRRSIGARATGFSHGRGVYRFTILERERVWLRGAGWND